MSDIKSLVKVDRTLVNTAIENYEKKVDILKKETDEAIARYKDGYKFTWWDKFRGRDKWDSEKLFKFDRKRSGYWTSMYSDLYGCGFLPEETYLIYCNLDNRSRGFLKSALYSGSEDIYLDEKCLKFIQDNT